VAVNRQYKSSVFTLLFSEPSRLRELYNALSGDSYDESAEIVINTLQDAVFMDRINDVSFTINNKLVVLIEQQSTVNPNMALRLLSYIARVYEKLIDNKRIYSRTKLIIPRPECIVLYNGPDEYPNESVMRLSDHFEKMGNYDKIDVELQVRVYNINKGRNPKLEQQSRTLNDYATLIATVREYEASGLILEEALKQAVYWCIRQGYLQDFLKLHSSEVVNMLITEWNWDDAKAVWYEEGLEAGVEKGFTKGTRQKQLEIARKMKLSGLPVEQIAEYTGLSAEEITVL
jgi:predicted transposase/invertase (TIGR01784 family)